MMGKAMQCGFLGMIFLASGTSALQCHSASSILHNRFWDEAAKKVSTPNITTCSKGQNACVEAQVILTIAQTALLVTHRGCAGKERNNGTGYSTSGDPHFTIKSIVSYCSTDLCNNNLSRHIPWSPGEKIAPEESGSNHCYAGFMFGSEALPRGVACSRGYDQCYHGHGIIQTELLSMSVRIKTCQQPSCVVAESQSFGPIAIRQWGSCCLGNYCNGTETAPQIQNILKPTPTTIGHYCNDTTGPVTSFTKPDSENSKENRPLVPGGGAGHQFNLINTTQDPVYETTIDYYYDIDNWLQPDTAAEAARFESCPLCTLLVALGIAAFGSWQ